MLLLINAEMPVSKTFQKFKAAKVVINVHVCIQQYIGYPNGNIILQHIFSNPRFIRINKEKTRAIKITQNDTLTYSSLFCVRS